MSERPVERLLQIDEMIRDGEYPSLAMFTQRFEISERAVYGDLRYLKTRFHAPLAFSKKHGGYYYTLAGWSLAQAETFQQTRGDLAPDQWLWNEIARRFGAEAAHDLRRDYVQRLLPPPKPTRTCMACGTPLSRNQTKWCDEHRPQRNTGKRAAHRPMKRRYCHQCGEPLGPYKRKWCDTCGKEKQKEYTAKWYDTRTPEQREVQSSRIAEWEQRRRWEDEEWRQDYNEKRRNRRQAKKQN